MLCKEIVKLFELFSLKDDIQVVNDMWQNYVIQFKSRSASKVGLHFFLETLLISKNVKNSDFFLIITSLV